MMIQCLELLEEADFFGLKDMRNMLDAALETMRVGVMERQIYRDQSSRNRSRKETLCSVGRTQHQRRY